MASANRSSISSTISPETQGYSTKRNSTMAGLDSSPGSTDDVEELESREGKKRQPVKRACNECRQQKLRCDVVQDPYTACSRCRRLKLDCKIESNFKRVGKRSRNAEMEREIAELRKQVANVQESAAGSISQQQSIRQAQLNTRLDPAQASAAGAYHTPPVMSTDQIGSHEAVASLLDLRSGFDGSNHIRGGSRQFKRIEDVVLSNEKAAELFDLFFVFYHPFLPLLNREQTPDEFYNSSPLLFWSIISVSSRRYQPDSQLLNSLAGPVLRLAFSTLGDIPQCCHVVKALCLLCSYPFPTHSTSTDPTFMLCGMMMQLAMQLGLHRPSHTQDFSKFRIELMEEELRDKVRTWATCNIVAQRVSSGYGMPSTLTLYDWTLANCDCVDPNYKLPEEIRSKLEIEKFSDKVSRVIFGNPRDPVGLCNDQERPSLISFLSRDYEELEQSRGRKDSITDLYLRAANLHLHLSAFFDNPSANNYRERLLSLYVATTSFLEAAMNLETEVGPALPYCPYYIYQMMIAGACTLLKLCKSFFATHINMDYTKSLFNRTIWAVRSASVSMARQGDLLQRLAEVLVQIWRLGGSTLDKPLAGSTDVDDSLMLKVRCRLSMSLLYDLVWRWREDARTRDRNLDVYLKNPTNPDSSDSSTNSSVGPMRTSSLTPGVSSGDPSLAPAPALSQANLSMEVAPTGNGNLTNGFMEPNYEVFDPLNWLLDGLVDFPYSYSPMPGVEAQGMV